MKRIFILLASTLLLSTTLLAQYPQQIANVKAQARIYADATIKKDYKTLMKYTIIDALPKARLNVMTEARVLKTIQMADSQRVQQGIQIKNIRFGEVLSIVKVNFEFQCTMEQYTETKMQFGTIISKSTILAISPDNGITWKYADATGRTREDMRKIMPKLSPQLIFAKEEAPKFIKDVAAPKKKVGTF